MVNIPVHDCQPVDYCTHAIDHFAHLAVNHYSAKLPEILTAHWFFPE